MTTREIAAEARALPREPTARWILGLVALMTVAWLAVFAWQVRVLPDQVPTHFGAGGEPDGWSSKTGALAFSALLPLLAAFPLPVISLLVLHRPTVVNMPNREWWTATAPRLRRFERLVREDLWLVAALMLGLFVVIQVDTTAAALSDDGRGIGPLFAAGMVSFLLLNAVLMARFLGGRYADDPDLERPTNRPWPGSLRPECDASSNLPQVLPNIAQAISLPPNTSQAISLPPNTSQASPE